MNRLCIFVIVIMCGCSAERNQNAETSSNEPSGYAMVGVWELRPAEEPAPYPSERIYLDLHDDGSCVFAIIRLMYNFGEDGSLLSYNNFGSERVEGTYTIKENRLSVELPDTFKNAALCPVGQLQNISDDTFQVKTRSGEIRSLYRCEDDAEGE